MNIPSSADPHIHILPLADLVRIIVYINTKISVLPVPLYRYRHVSVYIIIVYITQVQILPVGTIFGDVSQSRTIRALFKMLVTDIK